MNKHIYALTIILLPAFGMVIVGCDKSGGNKPPMPGIFKGAYLGCVETIILKSDGSFSQTLVFTNVSYTNNGSWNFEVRRMQEKVVFSRFLVAVDMSVSPSVPLNPPKEYNFYDGDWLSKSDRIEFWAEARYFVQRVSK